MKKCLLKLNILSAGIILLMPTLAYADDFKYFFGWTLAASLAAIGITLGWIILSSTLPRMDIIRKNPSLYLLSRIVIVIMIGVLSFYLTYYFIVGEKPFGLKSSSDPVFSVVPFTQDSEEYLKQEEIGLSGTEMVETISKDDKNLGTAKVKETKRGQIKGTRVNMRESPNLKAPIIFTFPGWEYVTIHGSTDSKSDKFPWYKVNYKDMTGWVYGQYVKQ